VVSGIMFAVFHPLRQERRLSAERFDHRGEAE